MKVRVIKPSTNGNSEEQRKINVKEDLAYINRMVLAKQIDGQYCKYSHDVGGVVFKDVSKHQFINYWESRYKFQSDEAREQIINACIDKLENGLTSREDFMKLMEENEKFEKDLNDISIRLGYGQLV